MVSYLNEKNEPLPFLICCSWSVFENMMNEATDFTGENFETYSDFEDFFNTNQNSIKELLSNKQQKDLIEDLEEKMGRSFMSEIKLNTKFFFWDEYIGVFVHKIYGNIQLLNEISNFIEKWNKNRKLKHEDDNGFDNEAMFINVQHFIDFCSIEDRLILKDMGISFSQLKKSYNIHLEK